MYKKESENNCSQLDYICEASFKSVASEDFQYILCEYYNMICAIAHHIIANDKVLLEYYPYNKDEPNIACPVFGFDLESEQRYCYLPCAKYKKSTKNTTDKTVGESSPTPQARGVLIGENLNYKKCLSSIKKTEIKNSIMRYFITLSSSEPSLFSNFSNHVQSELDFFFVFADENLKHFSRDAIYYNFMIFCKVFNFNDRFSALNIWRDYNYDILNESIIEVKEVLKNTINVSHIEQADLKSLVSLLEYQDVRNSHSKKFIHCLIMSLHNPKTTSYNEMKNLLTEISNISSV